MPKIIENLREKLFLEARKQIEKNGYSAMTIRSVAAACGVGTGTVYNYFSSKDELVAGFMLEDWRKCIEAVSHCAENADRGDLVVWCMYHQLKDFLEQHKNVFQDEGAAAGFSGTGNRYHGLLRSQLAKPLEAYCETAFEAEFIAEALLTWTVEGKSPEDINSVIHKIMEAR